MITLPLLVRKQMLASHTDTLHGGAMRKPSGGCKNLDSKRPVAWLAKPGQAENLGKHMGKMLEERVRQH